MPTFAKTQRFIRDYNSLSPDQRAKFREAVTKFVEDLKRDGKARASLRVRELKLAPGIFEMTWEGSDGRATFQYGEPIKDGMIHIIWRRVGKHIIFDVP